VAPTEYRWQFELWYVQVLAGEVDRAEAPERALASFRAAAETMGKLAAADPKSVRLTSNLAITRVRLGETLVALHRDDEAVTVLEDVLRVATTALEQAPANHYLLTAAIGADSALGEAEDDRGNRARSLEHLSAARARAEAQLAKVPDDGEVLTSLVQLYVDLGRVHAETKDLAAARAADEKALTLGAELRAKGRLPADLAAKLPDVEQRLRALR
jgi:tetratricopeptide (TPR) repeat protein